MKQQPYNVLLLEEYLKSEEIVHVKRKIDIRCILFKLPQARRWFNCILKAMPEKL